MQINYIDKNTDEDFTRILQMIQNRKNGVVADTINKSGMDYKMVWGVSIPHLRKVASEFNPNNRLAKLLWNHKWRETMILATMLCDSNQLENKELEQWMVDLSNLELAEQMAFNLISDLKRSSGQWINMLQKAADFERIAVLKGLYRVILKKKLSLSEVQLLLNGIQEFSLMKEGSVHEISAFGQLCAIMGRAYPELTKPILAFIYKFVNENPSWKPMLEIAETEFYWLNDT